MSLAAAELVLCVNGGSASTKCAVYRVGDGEELVSEAAVDDTGIEALDTALEELGSPRDDASAVGHRVVHGGPDHYHPTRIDDGVLADLAAVVPLAPLHQPPALAAIAALRRRWPERPQVACFDTAFHHSLPESSWRLPLPDAVAGHALRRYGFHGLSCEYVVDTLGADAIGRGVIAHLGGGSSVTAVEQGRSVDTTMGLTPTGGVVMTTRSGDLDPGVLIYLARERGYDPDRLERLVDQEAGLAALSGASGDMRDLLARRAHGDPSATLAVDVYTTRVRMQIGAYAVRLGALDTLVFTGGIGASAAPVRAEICRGLDVLGVALDEQRNDRHAGVISAPTSTAVVRALPTDEQLVIARRTHATLAGMS
jgi:acetate kinase